MSKLTQRFSSTLVLLSLFPCLAGDSTIVADGDRTAGNLFESPVPMPRDSNLDSDRMAFQRPSQPFPQPQAVPQPRPQMPQMPQARPQPPSQARPQMGERPMTREEMMEQEALRQMEMRARKKAKKEFKQRSLEANQKLHLLGTLGRTYYRQSHPVPTVKHPRAGMLAIRTTKKWPISVDGMSGIRLQSGVWLFESNRPLDIGVSHVVRVEHRRNVNDIEATAYRFVRLIPGRVVYLNFDVDSLP